MKKKQSGAVLLVSLMLLTAITFLATMGLERSNLQSRIVGNIQLKEMAFQCARNDQDFWFENYSINKESTELLNILMSSFDLNEDNERQYRTVPLVSSPLSIQNPAGQLASQAQVVENGDGDIALAEGQQADGRIKVRIRLDSDCRFNNRNNGSSSQISGLSFPAITQQNKFI